MEEVRHDICNMRERIAKLEAQQVDSEKALDLARDSVSKTNLGAVITFVLSVLAVAMAWLKK